MPCGSSRSITIAANSSATSPKTGVLRKAAIWLMAPKSVEAPTSPARMAGPPPITVIGGGPAILAGLVSASALFGAINQIAAFLSTPVFGEVALLFAAIVMLRLLPQGITGRFFKGSL